MAGLWGGGGKNRHAKTDKHPPATGALWGGGAKNRHAGETPAQRRAREAEEKKASRQAEKAKRKPERARAEQQQQDKKNGTSLWGPSKPTKPHRKATRPNPNGTGGLW